MLLVLMLAKTGCAPHVLAKSGFPPDNPPAMCFVLNAL